MAPYPFRRSFGLHEYIHNSQGVLLGMTYNYNFYHTNRVRFINWYEIYDAKSEYSEKAALPWVTDLHSALAIGAIREFHPAR